ncbi:hypothetical protein OAC89_03465, partial [Deltaproteobacteria bacterium]|nr:hypothetical protein [Deltaproteobacteria bacterium]
KYLFTAMSLGIFKKISPRRDIIACSGLYTLPGRTQSRAGTRFFNFNSISIPYWSLHVDFQEMKAY